MIVTLYHFEVSLNPLYSGSFQLVWNLTAGRLSVRFPTRFACGNDKLCEYFISLSDTDYL